MTLSQFEIEYPLATSKNIKLQFRYEQGDVRMPGPYIIVGTGSSVDTYNIKHLPTGVITDTVPGRCLFEIDQIDQSSRPGWPETWMNVARVISKRSPDFRLKVAAIVVPEDNTGILAQGYNGGPKGLYNEAQSIEPGRSGFIHAEANCLIKCPYHFPLKKHMYVTHSPCPECSRLIINAGISRVVYDVPYRDTSGLDLLKSAGIEVMTLLEAIKIVE